MNYINEQHLLAGVCNGDALFTVTYKFNIYIYGTWIIGFIEFMQLG